jgi:hypothetical protein
MISWISFVDPVLTFIAGLLIGIAGKKGAMAVIIGIVGFIIAGYVGLSFIPAASLTRMMGQLAPLIFSYMKNFQFGVITMSLSIILFLVGLVIGVWKG